MTYAGDDATTLIEMAVREGLHDQVDLLLLDAWAVNDFGAERAKARVLECVEFVLAHGLMELCSFVDHRFVPHEGSPAELTAMVSRNYMFDEHSNRRGDEYLYLYWLLNTDEDDDFARSTVR